MKRVLSLAVCSVVLFSVALAFDATQDFRTFMAASLPRVAKAFESKDVKYFDSVMAPDFTEKEMGRTYNRKQSLAEMKQMFTSVKSIKCSLKLISAKASGDKGTAITSGHMVILTPPDKAGKGHTMVMDMTLKETWVRRGKGWLIQTIREHKPSKMTMDGKPYDPSHSGGH